MRVCPSCGGVIGRDCFNPQECAEIVAQQQHQEGQFSYEVGLEDGRRAASDEISRLRDFIKKRVHCQKMWNNCGYHGRRIYLEAEKILEL